MGRKCVVTGGSGFVGRHLVNQLVESGKYDVTVFDVRDIGLEGVNMVVGDIRDIDQVEDAVEGAEVVFHCATVTPSKATSMNMKLMFAVNVKGTDNVINACITKKVPYLVHTSSASVVFNGRPLYMVDESIPYTESWTDFYTTTKVEGEKKVLAANGKGGLRTVALRPSAVFGEYDTMLVPSLIEQARLGKTKYLIGNGKNEMDWTYAGNVALAHILAAEALPMKPQIGGNAYFITNDQPERFWDFVGDIVEGLGYTRPWLRLPFFFVFIIALLFEWVIRPALAPFKETNSTFTVQRIILATTNRTFKCEKAKHDFGYTPNVSMDLAKQRTIQYFEDMRKGPEKGKKKKW